RGGAERAGVVAESPAGRAGAAGLRRPVRGAGGPGTGLPGWNGEEHDGAGPGQVARGPPDGRVDGARGLGRERGGGLRALLGVAAGDPPHRVSVEAVRRRVVRRRALEWVAGAAAVTAIAVVVPLIPGAFGHPSGTPAMGGRGSTVYVASFGRRATGPGTVIPISTVTNRPGTPIPVGRAPRGIAITPDGTAAHVVNFYSNTVAPISIGTNRPGTPIPVGRWPWVIAITPDGKAVYVVNRTSGTVTPISTATNTPGTPIPVGRLPYAIAITPDGKTAYVANAGSNTVTPISTATNTAGKPIPAPPGPTSTAITPDRHTPYV